MNEFKRLINNLDKAYQRDSRCQYNKKTMEKLNGTHYEFGKVKGIFDVRGTNHVMIELVEVNK